MRITTDSSALVKQLKELEAETKRKLESMVVSFCVTNLYAEAVEHTPIGDEEKYPTWYEERAERLNLPPYAGYARASWKFVIGTGVSSNGIVSPRNMTAALGLSKFAIVEQSDLSDYMLGQTILLHNSAPYIGKKAVFPGGGPGLEGGYSKQAPQGIMGPMSQLIASYKFPFKQYFDRG